jgi:colicin import membrane protein
MTPQVNPGQGRPEVEQDELPVIADDMPVMYEDEGQDEMGDSNPHTLAGRILSVAIEEHLRSRPEYRVFANLNTYYHRTDRWAYLSPDVMVVVPGKELPDSIASYRIGEDGPAPVLTIEVLSRRSFQQQDLTNKPIIYSRLGVAEYILVDGSGIFLPQKVRHKRLQEDGTWRDEQDPDGGVTSQLGFRIVLEGEQPRVLDARTGKRYVWPDEAQALLDEAQARLENTEGELEKARSALDDVRASAEAEARARRQAEEQVRALQAELARLRGEET